jgi:hypothetical protein
MTIRKWIWIALGVAVGLAVIGVALLGAGIYLVARNVRVEPASALSAEQEFDLALQRFAGQKPLVRVDGNDWTILPDSRPETGHDAGHIEALQVLVWDPGEGRLARVRVPFWLVRLAGPGTIKLSPHHGGLDLERLSVTLDDLELHGPGLILDLVEPDETRVLVWAE